MATFGSDESNLRDLPATDWRWVVYPVIAAVVLGLGGFGVYYYLQQQRDDRETAARAAIVEAKSPAELTQVADRFPGTSQGLVALLAAAAGAYEQKDYAAAAAAYQRVISATPAEPSLRDSAQIGLASTLQAQEKTDDAIRAYRAVADRGNGSPYAPFALTELAVLSTQKSDKEGHNRILKELAGLEGQSDFIQQARMELQLASAETPAAAPAPATPPAPATNAAPAAK